MIVNATTLCEKVGKQFPDLNPLNVTRAILKLKKLAATIQKRDATRRAEQIVDPVAYDAHTDYFYRKAYDTARGIDCDFVGMPDIQQYWLRIDMQQERIA